MNMSGTEKTQHITDEQIRRGILDTLNEAGDRWIPLREARAEWDGYGDVTRDRLEAAILDLVSTHSLRLIPEQNQKILTDADREAAVRMAGTDFHLLHRNDS